MANQKVGTAFWEDHPDAASFQRPEAVNNHWCLLIRLSDDLFLFVLRSFFLLLFIFIFGCCPFQITFDSYIPVP